MKIAVFIDGGHLRSYAKKAHKTYDPAFVMNVAKSCAVADEQLFRVLYYDCDQFSGEVTLPISNGKKKFTPSGSFMKDLAEQEFVAVRKGVLKFRGWDRTKASLQAAAAAATAGNVAPPLADADFQPRFEQKGVDLRIGLDLITMANAGAVDLMVVMTGDTDLIPAFKIVRSRGFQVAGVNLPGYQLIGELKQHIDIFRTVSAW